MTHAASAASAFFQTFIYIGPGHLECGNQTKQNSCDQRDDPAESQNTEIEVISSTRGKALGNIPIAARVPQAAINTPITPLISESKRFR